MNTVCSGEYKMKLGRPGAFELTVNTCIFPLSHFRVSSRD